MKRFFSVAFCVTRVFAAGCSRAPQGDAIDALPKAHRAWLDAGAKNQDLLYVSNGNAEVTVYRYWQQQLVGVLTDFTEPKGICTDANQNVYIADYAARQIVEYAHGGTKPIAKFDDSPDSPYSCWVDRASGNLAVANDDGTSAQGNIAIWSAASGIRTTYTDSAITSFQFCAFDDHGNLLATNGSVDYRNTTMFAWLPKGGAKLINVRVPQPNPSYRKWYSVLGIQWDGKYFVIDDYDAMYRESLIHGQVYYVGTTEAYAEESSGQGPVGFYTPPNASQATQVVQGMRSEESYSSVDYWKYPAGGGDPIAQITHAIDQPFGVAVSLKK